MKKCCTVLLLFFSFLSFFVYREAFAADEAQEVHFLDMAQSDCILIKGKEHNYLIDTGTVNNPEKILKYLSMQGVTKIQAIFVTHYHEDHYGGLIPIASAFDVEKVYLPSHSHPMKEILGKKLRAKQITIEDITPEVQIKEENLTLKAIVLKNKKEIKKPILEKDENNRSIAIIGVIDGIRYAFMGDAEAEEEKEMTKELSHCEVLKVPHHGLNTSSSDILLDTISPKVAIITSDGLESPSEEVVRRIGERGICILRTDILGNIMIRNKNFSATKEEPTSQEIEWEIDANLDLFSRGASSIHEAKLWHSL